jgi:hypothetical protein
MTSSLQLLLSVLVQISLPPSPPISCPQTPSNFFLFNVRDQVSRPFQTIATIMFMCILISTILPPPNCPDQLWGSPSLLLNWYQVYFPGEKRPEREVDHSPPSSAESKNEWSYNFTPSVWTGKGSLCVFTWQVGKHREYLNWKLVARQMLH